MERSNAQIISRDLNELVEAANKNTISRVTAFYEQDVKKKLDEIALERNSLLFTAKQKRLNDIEVLSRTFTIANSLGITENNLNQITNNGINTNVKIAVSASQDLPVWYLYVEKTLNEKLKLLNNRSNDEPFIESLKDLDAKKYKFEQMKISSYFNTMTLIYSAIAPE